MWRTLLVMPANPTQQQSPTMPLPMNRNPHINLILILQCLDLFLSFWKFGNSVTESQILHDSLNLEPKLLQG